MILIFVQTLVFVNNIHERPLRSLPFVPTRSPSSKLRLALACLRRRSWPITCLHRPLVFIARSSILVAFTARKDYSLFEYRFSRIVRLGSQPFVPLARLHRPIVADRSVFGTTSHSSASSTVWRCVSFIHDPYTRADFSLREKHSRASTQIVAVRPYSLPFIEASSRPCLSSSPIMADYLSSLPARLHRPLVFIARSSILVAFTARKDYSLCEYRSSRIVRLGSQPFVPLARLHRPIVADRSVFGTISHSSASSTVWRCVSLIHDPYIRADFSLRE